MVKFTLESDFWKSCEPLVAAIERAERYAALPKFAHVVQELLKQCLLENSKEFDTVSGKDDELLNKAHRILSDVDVRVFVGDCLEGDFANCNAALKHIYLNPGWIGQIQRVFENDGADNETLKMHIAFLVVKLLHEYANALTPAILEEELAIRKKEAEKNPAISNKAHDKIPTKVGFKYGSKQGKPSMGDMGFACEELLTNGYRFYKGPEGDYAWDFFTIELYSFNKDTKKFEKQNARNYEELMEQVSSSKDLTLDDFHVVVVDSSKKRKGDHNNADIPSANPTHRTNYDDDEDEADEDEYDETGFSVKYGPRESGGNRDVKS